MISKYSDIFHHLGDSRTHSEVLELRGKDALRFSVTWPSVRGWELYAPGFPLHQVSEHRAGCCVSCCVLEPSRARRPGSFLHLSLMVGHFGQGHLLRASVTPLSDEDEDCLPTYARVRLN